MEAENSGGPSTSAAQIAANGDIILVVGPHKTRMQVHSFVLKNTSRYFSAMFGPHFSEGQDLGGDRPKEIPMPDDNADALKIICNIIHLRNDAVPETLNPGEVLQVAITADKFDCVVALKHASMLWLNPRDIEDILELGHLMAAAYVFDNAQAFREITLSMMLRHKDSYLPLTDKDIGLVNFIPWKTFCKY